MNDLENFDPWFETLGLRARVRCNAEVWLPAPIGRDGDGELFDFAVRHGVDLCRSAAARVVRRRVRKPIALPV